MVESIPRVEVGLRVVAGACVKRSRAKVRIIRLWLRLVLCRVENLNFGLQDGHPMNKEST